MADWSPSSDPHQDSNQLEDCLQVGLFWQEWKAIPQCQLSYGLTENIYLKTRDMYL